MAIRLFRSLRKAALVPLVFYQKHVSPTGVGKSCLYHPTCSEYAKRAILRHGIVVGTLLGSLRILRCTGLLYRGGNDKPPYRLSPRTVFGPFARFWRFGKKD